MLTVYGDLLSGNCYKIKLIMALLQKQHNWVDVNILDNETKSVSFLSMNPNGQIPILKINETDYLMESNAILNYLAEGSTYLPASGLDRAKVLQWQFFEQYSHEPYIAVARYINKYLDLPEDMLEEYKAKQEKGHKALSIMEGELNKHTFFAGNQPSIADISLFAYTHVAHEGGFSLEQYPNIKRWISAIEQLPGYIAMPTSSNL